MSQATEGILGESELPEQISRYLDLKLDKDAFLKPTADMVTEIYTRFLDKTQYDWRKPPRPGAGSTLLAQMLRVLKDIFSRYSIEHEFNFLDIKAPVRRRNTVFMNVMLYVVALQEDKFKQWQHEQEGVVEIKREIAQLDEELYNLVQTIGIEQVPSNDEVEQRIEDYRRALKESQEKSDKIIQETRPLKEALMEKQVIREKYESKIEQAEQHIKFQNQKEILEQLREKVAKDEMVDKRPLKLLEAEMKRASLDLATRKNQQIDHVKKAEERTKALEKDIEKVRKEREDSANRRRQRSNQVKESINQANRKLDILRTRAESLCSSNDEPPLQSYKNKLENLLGEGTPTTDKNKTYIK